ncbi:MAG: hypothetical protein AVDCRST_MAG68-1909, partial [uncultured Gemmatimonadetes bacterium]
AHHRGRSGDLRGGGERGGRRLREPPRAHGRSPVAGGRVRGARAGHPGAQGRAV